MNDCSRWGAFEDGELLAISRSIHNYLNACGDLQEAKIVKRLVKEVSNELTRRDEFDSRINREVAERLDAVRDEHFNDPLKAGDWHGDVDRSI